MNRIVSLSESFPQITDIDEKKFISFMQHKPIWAHFNVSQQVYLSKSLEEKTALIREYYDFMDNGKKVILAQ